MPTPQIPSIPGDANVQQLRDAIIGINRYLNYLLSSLDTLNINRLDAKVITAGSITADKIGANEITANEIKANTITALQIAAGTITADRMLVTELSAISANLGIITAGAITSNSTLDVVTDAKIGLNLKLLDGNSSISFQTGGMAYDSAVDGLTIEALNDVSVRDLMVLDGIRFSNVPTSAGGTAPTNITGYINTNVNGAAVKIPYY